MSQKDDPRAAAEEALRLHEAASAVPGPLIERNRGAITEEDLAAREARDPGMHEDIATVAGNMRLRDATALAQFFARSRTLLPFLANAVIRTQKERDEARAELDSVRRGLPPNPCPACGEEFLPTIPAGHIYHADPLVERLCREWLVEGQTANDLEGVLARTKAACLKFSVGYHAHRKRIEGWTRPIPGQENWNDMRARLVREATEAGGQAAGEATAEGLVFGFDWVARTLASAVLETGEMPEAREEALVRQAAAAIRERKSLTSENVARLADVERILASPKGACTVGDLLGHLRWATEILAASRDVASASAEKQAPAKVDSTDMRRFYGLVTACHAGRDGECNWKECPQTRDGEPKKSGRHCPLDKESNE